MTNESNAMLVVNLMLLIAAALAPGQAMAAGDGGKYQVRWTRHSRPVRRPIGSFPMGRHSGCHHRSSLYY